MISNTSLKDIGVMLNNAASILIFPHVSPDGDAIGSCAALCRAMRSTGKNAWVLLDDEIPGYLRFMDTQYFTDNADCVEAPDICICVDCSEESRFIKRSDKFNTGRFRICIDHHEASEGLGDYYYIDEREAAASQIIYKLLVAMDVTIDSKIAESLYVGINTDTGSFQYSNTTAETHRIVSDLLETGIDHSAIAVLLYHNISLRKLRLQSEIIKCMEVIANGKAAVSYVTKEMLDLCDAEADDSEGAVDILRNIEGIELAAFLKEKDGGIKVSMRAKSYGVVNVIAMKFGGGGHAKAAGCTLDMSMEKALETIKNELNSYWESR